MVAERNNWITAIRQCPNSCSPFHVFQPIYLLLGDNPRHVLQISQVYCCFYSVASIPKGYMPDRGRNVCKYDFPCILARRRLCIFHSEMWHFGKLARDTAGLWQSSGGHWDTSMTPKPFALRLERAGLSLCMGWVQIPDSWERSRLWSHLVPSNGKDAFNQKWSNEHNPKTVTVTADKLSSIGIVLFSNISLVGCLDW